MPAISDDKEWVKMMLHQVRQRYNVCCTTVRLSGAVVVERCRTVVSAPTLQMFVSELSNGVS